MNATANVAITPERVDYTSIVQPSQRAEELIEVRAHGAAFNHKAPRVVKCAEIVNDVALRRKLRGNQKRF